LPSWTTVIFDPGQSNATAVPVEPILPVVVVIVVGTFPELLLAGPTPGTEEDCPPIGPIAVLETAVLPAEQ
jgi:hypothetical protein